MKKSNRGCPSSESKKDGLQNAVNNCIRRAEELILRFLKNGAAFDSAIISAGYNEFRVPEVVAIILYTD